EQVRRVGSEGGVVSADASRRLLQAVEGVAVEFPFLAQIGEGAPLRQRRAATLEAQLFARHQTVEAGEQRVAAGNTAVDEERWQVVLVGLRRLARRVDQGGEV